MNRQYRLPGEEGGPHGVEVPRRPTYKGAAPLYNINSRLNQIKQAIDAVAAEEMSVEEFRKFLNTTNAQLEEKGRANRVWLEESGYAASSPAEAEQAMAGMDLYEEGLTEIRRFLDDGDVGHLEAGFNLCKEGNQKMNKAMTINRDAYEDQEINFQM